MGVVPPPPGIPADGQTRMSVVTKTAPMSADRVVPGRRKTIATQQDWRTLLPLRSPAPPMRR